MDFRPWPTQIKKAGISAGFSVINVMNVKNVTNEFTSSESFSWT